MAKDKKVYQIFNLTSRLFNLYKDDMLLGLHLVPMDFLFKSKTICPHQEYNLPKK
jgi:hypothetical protein